MTRSKTMTLNTLLGDYRSSRRSVVVIVVAAASKDSRPRIGRKQQPS
jgi:hypothetical protein